MYLFKIERDYHSELDMISPHPKYNLYKLVVRYNITLFWLWNFSYSTVLLSNLSAYDIKQLAESCNNYDKL